MSLVVNAVTLQQSTSDVLAILVMESTTVYQMHATVGLAATTVETHSTTSVLASHAATAFNVSPCTVTKVFVLTTHRVAILLTQSWDA